jgi:thiosulfate dehydrogenase
MTMTSRRINRTLIAGTLALAMAPGPSWPNAEGERIALHGGPNPAVVACSTCHGPDGGGDNASGFPRLAGLAAGYIEKQLHAFAKGEIRNPVMTGMASGLTEQQIRDVAQYYASLPPATQAKAPESVSTGTGEALATLGNMAGRGIPACNQCHGPGGQGLGGVFPPLAGQPATYIKAQIAAWKAGVRSGDPLGMMAHVASLLTESETASVAAYYAAQPPGRPDKSQVGLRIDFEFDHLPGPSGGVDKRKDITQESPGTRAAEAHASIPAETKVSPPVGELAHQGPVAAGRDPGDEGYFQPPAHGAYPEGPMGESVNRGEAIFNATSTDPTSAKYVGNRQVCSGCHLDAGRLANSTPMWAAWVAYPAYRSKNRAINTFIERVQGCFKYSMNAQASAVGHPPEAESDTIVSLVSYAYWLATGAPTGDRTMPGRGYVKLAETEKGFDPERGAVVYRDKCAICHGKSGEGRSVDGAVVFPALWGKDSYNWGAGMHKIDTAAAYIKLNMPLGLSNPTTRAGWLSDQDAWDAAAYVDAQPRPQDPRFDGNLAETTKKYHASKYDYYGKRTGPDGQLLGEDSP